MNDDGAQAVLATLYRYVQKNECRDETLDRLRKQRHAATPRAHAAKRLESFQLQVECVKALNKLSLNHITKLRHEAAG